ncbi:MAG: tRNA (adenosine(37)-N6)-threonylcarbamoyltransferase complex ATPase subunit type 1 TsaE [Eubacterium sp.]|nr:tRNA (adenosine(37)-N6)-threonylcarbamoyltransferase complex ATPase subunit type 1 TsaE [Eubacterium sp.]
MEKYITKSYEETVALAEKLAKDMPKGTVIGYLGDLGAGKTAFTTGLAKGLGIDVDVSSPTFAICNEYKGNGKTLYHFDMYRIDGWEDLYSTGFFDFLETDAYIAAEWSENIYGALPDDAIIVDISKISDTEREFKICKKGEME